MIQQCTISKNPEKVEKSVIEYFVNCFINECKADWEERLFENDIKDIRKLDPVHKSNKRKLRSDIESSVKKCKKVP